MNEESQIPPVERNCPACKGETLKSRTLESDLLAYACDVCGGYWISSTDYWDWLENQSSSPDRKPYAEIGLESNDSGYAKLCADCGRILIKFKVGHGLDFTIDHCNSCNGVWLDRNQWEVLRSRDLHDEIHRIFTSIWQSEIRRSELREKIEQLYIRKLGHSDFEKLKEIRAWLEEHPERDAVLAFLNDTEPYGRT